MITINKCSLVAISLLTESISTSASADSMLSTLQKSTTTLPDVMDCKHFQVGVAISLIYILTWDFATHLSFFK